MKPFTENVIFLDTEFSDLDPYKGEILSVGLVKPSGEELYLELEYDGPVSDWVKEHIIPTLNGPKLSREEAKSKMREFIGTGMPYMVGYVDQFDDVYFHKLFQGDSLPYYWLPIDFASMMFAGGLDPEAQIVEGFPGYREHHALDDARLLRDCYGKFFEQYKK
jgi:hypothetical protein